MSVLINKLWYYLRHKLLISTSISTLAKGDSSITTVLVIESVEHEFVVIMQYHKNQYLKVTSKVSD